MNKTDFYGLASVATFEGAVKAIIGRTSIIEYGIIKEIPEEAEGRVVSVLVSVAKNKADARLYTCILAGFGGSSFIMETKPKVNDKVIVFFPRRYKDEMFNKDEQHDSVIFSKYATGYNAFSGIAFLANRFEEAYGNSLVFDDGNLKAKLNYIPPESEGEEGYNNTVLDVNADGSTSYKTIYNKESDSYKFSADVSPEGSFTLQNKDGDGNPLVTVSASSKGVVSIDNTKATVSVDADGNISVDSKGGKITLKNNSASLFEILNGMLNILNSSLATAGSPASHTVVPSQFEKEATDLGNLMQ